MVKDQPITESQLVQQMVSYLNSSLKGIIILKTDKGLSYEKVVQLIGTLRDVGGDRASLAVE